MTLTNLKVGLNVHIEIVFIPSFHLLNMPRTFKLFSLILSLSADSHIAISMNGLWALVSFFMLTKAVSFPMLSSFAFRIARGERR